MLKFLSYLSKMFIGTWLTTVFGFLVLIGLLDSLANGSDILGGGGGFADTFKYMALRAPVIFDRIFIFTIVVAILLTFVKLIRQHELVALLGFGISVPKQLLLMTPVVLAAAFSSITIIDYSIAPAVRSLQAWGIGEYKVKNITADNPLWLEDNGRIIKASRRINYNTLGNLELYARSDSGAVEEIIWAERATYEGSNWTLEGVEVLPVKGADGEPRSASTELNPRLWETRQDPKSIARLAAEPRDLSISEMRNFSKRGNSGSKPRFAYTFWHAHRITRPLAAFVLLLVAVPLMQRTARQDTGDKALIIGLAGGFLFLILDGAMATFAASGGMPVPIAIAMPIVFFGILGTWLCLKAESL
ncbi:LptF/LptG family permease [Hellea balneolensis]|uniref:LptF/LptG family permease n=1 Tax=Hellea balneolensis TaxID=287478 RepID=UPI0003FB8FBF|nr:LptF/LptG family permease [Hellea balneolensis]